MIYPNDLMSEVLYTSDQIKARAKEIACQINKDYEGKPLTIVCTLKGAVPFFSDVVLNVNINCNLEFIKASSYIGNTTTTIGNVKLTAVMNFDIKDRYILIVEDIVDTGLTCEKLINYFNENGCKQVDVATMLDKPERRVIDVKPKYVGFSIPDKFVIGYGLDYNEAYRNIDKVGVINKKYI